LIYSLLLFVPATALVSTGCGPQATIKQMRAVNASMDMAAYRAHAPTIDGPLTLEDALDYATRYNIEVWIAAQESKFEHELATQSALKMLPSLMAGTQYNERSQFDASSSVSLKTGKESLEPSYSSEKRVNTIDISATWNLLDFGISFLRSRQQSKRVLMAMENERRVRQNLALQVTRAYWRTATARDSAEEAERIGKEISVMLESIHAEIDEKTISEVDGLQRETSLLQRQDELRRHRREYLKAKTELAGLIGLPPGTAFTLAEVDFDEPVDPFEYCIEDLEREALRSRPELFEKDLEEAILHDEAVIAIAQMFPSPAAFWRLEYDNNRYLVFDQWNTVGIRASWDLLTLPQQFKQHDITKLQTALIVKQRTAIAVGILAQLHLSLIDYRETWEQHAFSETISRKCDSLLEAVRNQADEGKSHGGERLDHELKRLRARARYLTERANLMVARARLLNTIGREPACREEADAPTNPEREPDAAVGTLTDVENAN